MSEIRLNADDRLLLYGYGLFETLRVTKDGVELPFIHWQRMKQGGQVLGLNVPDFPQWWQEIKDYLHKQTFDFPFALRITLSGGSASQNISPQILFHTRAIPYTRSHYEQGIRVCLLRSPRFEHSIFTKIKSTNYLENLLAREEAFAREAFEGLWYNTQGYLVEGTMSNLFFVKNGVLFTPSLECGCLPGTRRSLILELASSLSIPFHEGRYPPSVLFQADEIFLTNALMGIMPVSQIDDHKFDLPVNSKSLTRRLAKVYPDFIKKQTLKVDC